MKVGILTHSLSRSAGGLFFSVRKLAQHLYQQNVDVRVLGIEDEHWNKDQHHWGNIPLSIFQKSVPGRYGFSWGLLNHLKENRYDIIHVHGMWNFASLSALYSHIIHKHDYIISPRGMLDPWILKKNKWLKKVWWTFLEKHIINRAKLLHVLSLQEKEAIEKLKLKPLLFLIPNGVDSTSVPKSREKSKRNMVYIGRYDNKKGLIEFLQAWPKSEQIKKCWSFNMYGWGDPSYINELKQIILTRQLENVYLHGSVYGQEKEQIMQKADAFALPSFSEGLPMAVLEASSYGIPSLITKESNVPEVFSWGAGREIHHGPRLTSEILSFLNLKDSDLEIMSHKATDMIKENFLWTSLSKEMNEVYMKIYTTRASSDSQFQKFPT